MKRRWGVHVRPKAQCAAYRFADGTEVGNVARDAEELPDGRYMTKQYFWIDNSYMAKVVARNIQIQLQP